MRGPLPSKGVSIMLVNCVGLNGCCLFFSQHNYKGDLTNSWDTQIIGLMLH